VCDASAREAGSFMAALLVVVCCCAGQDFWRYTFVLWRPLLLWIGHGAKTRGVGWHRTREYEGPEYVRKFLSFRDIARRTSLCWSS
jgi:hypothetical protein